MRGVELLERLAVGICGALLAVALVWIWANRLNYPFDLEWMEGGMLSHAWRLRQGLPLYDPPSAEFVPFIYPPGYPALVAALSRGFGLSIALGRAVSIGSILVAAAALSFAVRRAGGRAHEAVAVALVFLGTYPHAGAFYDLVRPDALSIALLGWAIALAPERHRAAPIAAGLLLVAATVAKHNAAILGLPLLVGIGARDRRAGLAFACAWFGGTAAVFGALEVATSGRMSTWLLEVPSAHRMLWWRGPVDSVREWGTALPVAFAVLGGGAVVRAAHSSALPPWVAAVAPVWTGIGLAWAFTYEPPGAEATVVPVAYAIAYFAIGAGPVALLVGPRRWDAEQALLVGVLAVSGGAAALMRIHDGGFVNVHTPLFWALSWALGLTLVRVRAARPALAPAVTAALCVQLGWASIQLRPRSLVPTAADEAVGWRLVAAIRRVDGPVLSPFNPWLPVYAGKAPSLHAMGVWDCNYPGGPFQDDLAKIQRALREQHWTLVVGGNVPALGDLAQLDVHYERAEEIVGSEDRVFWPRTGYQARPGRLWVPRERP